MSSIAFLSSPVCESNYFLPAHRQISFVLLNVLNVASAPLNNEHDDDQRPNHYFIAAMIISALL